MPKAEEQAAAAETNENLATPVPQHDMPLASIMSESPPDSNGKVEHPINLLGTVRGTGRKHPITFSPMGKFA